MIIKQAHLCTKMIVWTPKYSTKYGDEGEAVALLHKNKVDFATPTIIVEFPKAKHLEGQRFAIRKQDAQRHAVGSNGKAPMYELPLSHLEPWETPEEANAKIKEDIESFGWWN